MTAVRDYISFGFSPLCHVRGLQLVLKGFMLPANGVQNAIHTYSKTYRFQVLYIHIYSIEGIAYSVHETVLESVAK